MDCLKKTIKNNLLQLYIKQYGIDRVKYEDDVFDKIIDIICDTSFKEIFTINEHRSFVLRKTLGLFDNGEIQSNKDIAEQLGLTTVAVKSVFKDALRVLERLLIELKSTQDNRTRMSSLTNEKYNNTMLLEMDFDLSEKNALLKAHLYRDRYIYNYDSNIVILHTLYDLLSYSINDLKNTDINEKILKNIIDKIHSLNLKFIDELTFEEKKSIIDNSTEDMINNSSVDWIFINNKQKGWINTTIEDLKKNINQKYSIDKETIDYAKSMGIEIDNIRLLPKEELLNLNIEKLNLSNSILVNLNNYKIKTLSDIILHKKNDFKLILNYDDNSFIQLVKSIHNLGLHFADEKEEKLTRSNKTSSKSEQSIDKMKLEYEQLVNKFKELKMEKEQLNERLKHLDKEINHINKQLNILNTIENGITNEQTRK